MSGVDSRVTTMKFDNAQFERGAAQTMSTLDKLKKLLNLDNAGKGLQDVQKAADRFNLHGMENGIQGISKAWLGMATIAITALANITNRAVDAGLRVAKSFTIDPIKAGLQEYNTTLNSIQTIMANTGLTGKKGLEKVNSALQNLNHYSDKTIYNFTQMARNIGTFTAAGVDLKTSTAAIKGIANLAAVSGSSAEQASTAMYQLSQALAAGRVSLMDWNSVVNAGMGGKVFQNALMETARVHGVAIDTMVKEEGSFRNTLQKGWLTSSILTETLNKFTGDLTKKQLKAMGYNEKQITEIQKMGRVATDAATKVKTLPQLVDTLQEAIGSGWSKTFQIIFGNINEAKELFTNVNNVLGGFIQGSANARNKVLGDWKKLGGRTVLIEGISNAFHALQDILKPIRDAFRDIFPAKTGKDLYNITVAFRNFTEGLQISDETADKLKRTFRGVFAIFDIIGHVVKGAIGVIASLFGTVGEGAGGFLDVTASIGDWLVALDEAIKKGEGLTNFFHGLAAVLKVPIQLIQALAGFFVDLFQGMDSDKAQGMTDALGELGAKLTPLQALGQRVTAIFSGFGRMFQRIADIIKPLTGFLSDAIHGIGAALADAFSGNSFDKTLDAINTGLFAGLILLFRKFVNGGLGGILGNGKGTVLGAITGSFNQLTGVLGAMQANLKANTLLKIAGAIALITLSVVALSLIDSDKLTKAMAALAVGFGQLLAAMAIMEKVSSSTGFIKMPFIATGLLIMAGAMVVLAAAVKIFSTMSWEELRKGLIGVAGSLVAISAGMKLMPKSLPVTGAGLILVAVGLNAIAVAMKIMATMNWEEIGKGLTAMAGALVGIAAGMQLMPTNLPITAAGLVLVGVALNAIAVAMKIMATLGWQEMAKGITGVAGALVVIAGAMQLMPINLPITAAGLVLVSGALVVMAGALKLMATMSWEEIGKGLTTLGGAMAILAGGLNLMSGTLGGSAALLVAAGALAILTPVLVTLGSLSWESIAKGLVTLAGAFTVLGLAGLILAPLTPAILALSTALALTGAGLALAGAGALAFAAAFAIITATGAAGIAVLAAMLNVIIDAIPATLHALGVGLIEFAKAISKGGPAFVHAFVVVLESLLDAVIKVAPKIAKALEVLIHQGLKVIRNTVPDFVRTGIDVILALMRGIRGAIPQFVKTAADIVVAWLRAMGKQLPRLADAAMKFIIDFINAISAAIDENADELGEAGGRLAVNIVKGIVKGLAAGVGQVAKGARDLAKTALKSAADFLGIKSPSREFYKLGKFTTEGFRNGMIGGMDDVRNAMDRFRDLVGNAITATKAEVDDLKAELKELNEHPTKNAEKIKETTEALGRVTSLYNKAREARHLYNQDLKDERQNLNSLARQYDDYTQQIDEATDALNEAVKARDDFAKSTTDEFSALPDIEDDTTVEDYAQRLADQEAANEKFLASLNLLRDTMNLNDDTYQQLLDEGVGIQPFIDSLVAGGPKAVDQINTLTAALGESAAGIGSKAASELYQAGVDSAQGFLDGLIAERDAIEKEMSKLARQIVKAIKKALGIKSPSKVMEQIGKFTNKGLAQGLDKTAAMVTKSAENVADSAVDSIKSTLEKVSASVNTSMNVDPVIRPVLDLSQVSKDASSMNKMLDKQMVAKASYGQAMSISNEQAAKLAEKLDGLGDGQPTQHVEFKQYNTSPKALSPTEVYRNTKNVLSLAKEALK